MVEAARRADLTTERLAETALASLLQADDTSIGRRTGREGEPPSARAGKDLQTTAADYEGPFVGLDEALDAFRAELERRLVASSLSAGSSPTAS